MDKATERERTIQEDEESIEEKWSRRKSLAKGKAGRGREDASQE